MYASLVTVSIDPNQADAARANLEATVVPMVKQSPGVKWGVWLDPKENTGMSMVGFDTKENAEAALAMIPDEPGPGVKVLSKEVREVVAGF